MRASELAARLAALPPLWDTCRRWDDDHNPTPRPTMAGDRVTAHGYEWSVNAIDPNHGDAHCTRYTSRGPIHSWIPLHLLKGDD